MEVLREMLIFLLGLRLTDDGQIVPLSLMAGQREVMSRLLAKISEDSANKAAASDEDFSGFAEQVRRQAMGESVAPAARAITKLLTEDHTERERDAGRRFFQHKLRQAGVLPRPTPPRDGAAGAEPLDAPDAADRARAGLPAAPRREAPGAGGAPVDPRVDVLSLRRPDEGGLVFDDDVAAVYRAQPRALSMDDPHLAIEVERQRQARAQAPPLTAEQAAWAVNLDPATAPLGQLAAVARAAGVVQSAPVAPVVRTRAPRTGAADAPPEPVTSAGGPTTQSSDAARGVDPLDDAPPEVP